MDSNETFFNETTNINQSICNRTSETILPVDLPASDNDWVTVVGVLDFCIALASSGLTTIFYQRIEIGHPLYFILFNNLIVTTGTSWICAILSLFQNTNNYYKIWITMSAFAIIIDNLSWLVSCSLRYYLLVTKHGEEVNMEKIRNIILGVAVISETAYVITAQLVLAFTGRGILLLHRGDTFIARIIVLNSLFFIPVILSVVISMIMDHKLRNRVQDIQNDVIPIAEPQVQQIEENRGSSNAANQSVEGRTGNINKDKSPRALEMEKYGGVWMGPNEVQMKQQNINEICSADEESVDNTTGDAPPIMARSSAQNNYSLDFSMDDPEQPEPNYDESEEHKAYKKSLLANFILCILYSAVVVIKFAPIIPPSYLKLNIALTVLALCRMIMPVVICYNFRLVTNITMEYLADIKNSMTTNARNVLSRCCNSPNDVA